MARSVSSKRGGGVLPHPGRSAGAGSRRRDRLAVPTPASRAASGPFRGAVLLEVVLAMGLFFVAAGIVTGGLEMTAKATRGVKLQAQAADLAVTVMSQMQIGLVAMATDGPHPFEEGPAGWTWQVIVTPLEIATTEIVQVVLWRVEVIVASDGGYQHRLVELVPAGEELLVMEEL